MSTERLVRAALEDSVTGLPCPEPDIDQLLRSGRAMRRRRVAAVASLAAAAVLVLVLAGLSFDLVGKVGRALEPVPANSSAPTATIEPAFTSEHQQWIDALPAGPPPTTPYWHAGILHVNGVQIPAPYAAVNIHVAGQTVLVTGYESKAKEEPPQWALVRGARLEPVPVPAGAHLWGLSVDGRIAYGAERQVTSDTTRFFTWDTETNTALASRTVPGLEAELWGVDAAGSGYLQTDLNDPRLTRWDVRADTILPTDLTYQAQAPETFFDALPPWMPLGEAYRSPDGTRRVFTVSAPSDSPPDCCSDRLRVRPVGPDAVDPKDVQTLAISQEFPELDFEVGYRNGYWTWWESNEAVLLSVDGDLQTYLLRCPANGAACQRVIEFGTLTYETDAADAEWTSDWGFARAPVSE